MKMRTVGLYFVAAALVLLVAGVSAKADLITLEDQPAGPSIFALAVPQTLNYLTSSGPLTITGGTILTKTLFLPADQTNVYGTAFFGNGLLPVITLTFTSPINNFFFSLINGQIFPDTFIVSDNLGNSQTFLIPSNGNLGSALVSFPTVGNVITIFTPDPNWDYFIDDIGFNQATPTPEPGSLALLGLGAFALAAIKLSKK